MRVGLLGGSFNPPHLGHLALAEAVRERLELDELILIPAARPPHKPGEADMASPQDRLAMTRLAAEPLGLTVSDLELHRQGPSYTIDTVRALRAERPDDTLFWIIGADTVDELPTWKEGAALLSEVSFVAVNRPGHDVEAGLEVVARELGRPAADDLRGRIIQMEPQPISSTEVRRRVLAGESIEGLVPAAVAEYIQAHSLYGRSFVAVLASVLTLKDHVGERVELRGWIYKFRGKGKIAFLHMRDGSGIVQAVLKRDDVGAETIKALKEAGQESSIRLQGTVHADERAPGGFEIKGDHVELVSACVGDYPIALQSEQGIDYLLSQRHLWLRSAQQHAVLRVRSEVCQTIRDFFYERDFVLTDAPIFTPSACEGTSNLFNVQYFEEEAYLTQSGQLYMEATAMAHGKVYCFGPTFRAERSKTRRHLTEFWMCEPEIAYGTLDDVMDLSEEFIEAIVTRVLERCQTELKVLERDTAPLEAIKRPFPRVTYDEAVKILHEAGREFEWGDDFGAPDETVISEKFDKPVLIHRYPQAVKAFYMQRDPQDERLALCVDVIAPEGVGEIIGGGERASDLDYLLEQIKKHDLPQEAFEWYLDLRRYGSVPHAGFGLGLERTVAWICGREHVREAIPFPRTLYRKEP